MVVGPLYVCVLEGDIEFDLGWVYMVIKLVDVDINVLSYGIFRVMYNFEFRKVFGRTSTYI